MSLFGSMFTAVSGLNAQSRALANVSDNVANSQTTGFKRLETSFSEQLAKSSSSSTIRNIGVVQASTKETASIGGNVEIVENPLSMALSGNGMFAVQTPTGTTGEGSLNFNPAGETLYTRAGDFTRDKDGFLVNGSGNALVGYDLDGPNANPTALQLIKIEGDPIPSTPAVATTEMAILGTLAADGSGGPVSMPMTGYDAAGNTINMTATFAYDSTADVPGWTVAVTSGTDTLVAARPFDPSVTLAVPTSATEAEPTIALNLAGVTSSEANATRLASYTGDGSPEVEAAAFESASVRSNGDIIANYDNGQTRIVARVPVMTFANVDAMERRDGQAFAVTSRSGTAAAHEAGTGGAASLEGGAVERSNVDLTSEFAKLIVAQRAYSANTKLVTTSDEMLSETINMRR